MLRPARCLCKPPYHHGASQDVARLGKARWEDIKNDILLKIHILNAFVFPFGSLLLLKTAQELKKPTQLLFVTKLIFLCLEKTLQV